MASIAQPHLIAASGAGDLAAKVSTFVELAKESARDGISVSEFSELAVALLHLCVEMVDSIPADGPAKKQFVLDAIGMLFDAVADKVVPLPLYPIWVFVKAPTRSLVLAIASGSIESILPIVRQRK